MKWPEELKSKAQDTLNLVYTDNVEPSKENALRFFHIDPAKVKVVILGQDPYPTPGVANGRAFAVNKGVKIPQSLKNIFKEIDEVYGIHKTDRTLESWENQGVLLLNTSLTVKVFEPNSHKRYWKPFTDELIKWMADNLDVIWVLWGNESKKYKSIIGTANIIEDAHPSPLSVRHRNKETFKKISTINW